MIKVNEILNIKSIALISNTFFFQAQNKIYEAKNPKAFYEFKNDFNSLMIASKTNIFWEDKNEIIGLNFKKKELYKYKNNNYQYININPYINMIDCKIVALMKNKDKHREIGLFDLNAMDFCWVNNNYWGTIGLQSTNNVYLGSNSSNLISIIRTNGLSQWQSDLSSYIWYQFDGQKPAHIQQIVGISENILLVWMAGEQLLGLDVATGKVLWKIDFASYFHITKWFTGSYYWNIKNHKLYLLKYLYYFEVDLASQEVKILWKNPEESYSITHCCYTDDYVYFIALGSELGIEILGTFNRLSLTIDWLEYLTMPRLDAYSYVSFHQAPQVDGDRLYVLDSGGTLHIFEKESSTE